MKSNFLSKIFIAFGFLFLYLPIIIVIIYSFNDSKLVTIWSGFSLKWYRELLADNELITALWTSLKIACASASLATIIGCFAGLVLARFGSFKGKFLFSTMLSAPFVVPEIVTGFSLLILFVNLEHIIGWPTSRGITTVIIAHTTIGVAYITLLVQARMIQFDKSIEEAALDLGSRPFKVFCVITLPLITPALMAGWLLAFTISIDDLVIASFTSGPGATTLPMLIYARIRMGVSPEINALATLIILTITAASLIIFLPILWKKIIQNKK